MGKKITISIIMAVYNRADVVEQAIFSAVNQTYKNIEFIIVDGGSTDGTIDIIKKYEDKISCWVSEPDNGIYDALNKGIKIATGDYIEVLGSDDCFIDENSIARVVAELTEDIDILSATVIHVDEKTHLQMLWHNYSARNQDTYNYRMIPHQGMFVKRELAMKYPFELDLRVVADYKFFLTCYFDDSIHIKYVDFPVVFYSLDGVSSDTSKELQLIQEKNQVRTYFGLPLLPPPPPPKNIYLKRFLKKIHLFELVRYLRNRFVKKGRKPHSCKWGICRWCGRGN